MLLQRELGSLQVAVSAQRCTEIEPALASDQQSITEAIDTPSECEADCQKTCDGLIALLSQCGVQFLLDTPIEQIQVKAGVIVAIKTPQGEIQADQ